MSADDANEDTHLAWLGLMLAEIEARRQERREAEEERARRNDAAESQEK